MFSMALKCRLTTIVRRIETTSAIIEPKTRTPRPTGPVSKSPFRASYRLDKVVPKDTIITIQGSIKGPVATKCFSLMDVAPMM